MAVIEEESNRVAFVPPEHARRGTSRIVLLCAMVVVLASAVGAAVVVARDARTPEHPRPAPSSQSRDETVRDLVERAVVPAASLDNGSQILNDELATAPPSRDDIVRDLVERGLVPAAKLDDGSQITGSSTGS